MKIHTKIHPKFVLTPGEIHGCPGCEIHWPPWRNSQSEVLRPVFHSGVRHLAGACLWMCLQAPGGLQGQRAHHVKRGRGGSGGVPPHFLAQCRPQAPRLQNIDLPRKCSNGIRRSRSIDSKILARKNPSQSFLCMQLLVQSPSEKRKFVAQCLLPCYVHV